ncbi:hypothetical protein TWF694_007322 [Orbilia ellipsospora]|uniref:Uncharacterized protein n=1 Tax=Orbilia ellipsospora TaxID=2528407 RepID=A0AAV9XIA3_9PEZI
MDKCWFVLRQTHYAPPENGSGLIQLGHLIPDLEQLDQVINVESGPHKFLRGMVVSKTCQEKFQWKINTDNETSVDINTTVPIAAAAGAVSAGGKLGVLFKSSVGKFWEFDRLDTEIFNPTYPYVSASLKDQAVLDYIQRAKKMNRWTMFMISGLAIARGGAKHTGTESSGRNIHGGPEVSAAGIVDVGLDVGFKRDSTVTANFNTTSDFIWAIRLTRLHKGIFSELLEVATFSKGATYSKEDGVDVEKELADEGMGDLKVVQVPTADDDSGDGDIFVLPGDADISG